jgi:hypothetical protein
MVTTSMMGVSISSAILAPKRATTPHNANDSKHEARSEYEREIEQSGFQNLHDGLLPPSAPCLALFGSSI